VKKHGADARVCVNPQGPPRADSAMVKTERHTGLIAWGTFRTSVQILLLVSLTWDGATKAQASLSSLQRATSL
jgi:hypothetical protein